MSKHPDFKPGKSVTLQFGDEVLNGDIHWRNTLLEILLYTDYRLNYITEFLDCSLGAILLIIDENNPSMLGFKQGARLVGLHEKIKSQIANKPPIATILTASEA